MTMTAKEKLAEWDEADRLEASIFDKEIEAVKGIVSVKIKTAKRGDSIGGEISMSQNFRDSFKEPARVALVAYYKPLGWVFIGNFGHGILRWNVKMES